MEFNNINIKYNNRIIYEDFNIKFEEEKINCIIGKSGCGKTTLLNYISQKLMDNNEKISYIFQQNNLIPWQNIYNNIKIVAKGYYKGKKLKEEINNYLKLMELEEFKESFPNELSGGMKQKVNIIRGLIGNNKIIIMDEPFKSLDINSKNNILNIIKDIKEKYHTTILLVTHDIDEIEALSDVVYLIGETPVKIIEKSSKEEIKNIIKKL